MISNQILEKGIDAKTFYGDTHSSSKYDSGDTPRRPVVRHTTILGPSATWITFSKQQDVLDYVAGSNLELYPFTFQDQIGNRHFLAAHPIIFWDVDEQRESHERHSYEIIQENKPCKLYFDIEFEPSANKGHNGDRMVNTFINLVCIALRNQYGVSYTVSDVLILDSSSASKFSCHLIFPNVIFENNYQAGYFVKRLCHEIRFVNLVTDLSLLSGVQPCDEINELSVLSTKGRRKLFCDEAVYTKNRHFRMYKSSKWGKNVPLKKSDHNQFAVSEGLDTFLCSFITYCPQMTSRLTYADDDLPSSVPRGTHFSRRRCENITINPFTEIDQCIRELALPGSIYRSRYYPDKRVLVYDIVGNRFCANIGRQHKSNNIMYVVDVNTLSWYQRCYDPDCADFRSPSHKLSVDESIFINHDIDDADFLLVDHDRELGEKYFSYRDPMFSSSEDDEDLVTAADQCELLNRSRGKTLFFQDADDDLMAHVAEKCEKSLLLSDDEQDEQLMLSVAEECESLVMKGKRKLSEHLADQLEAVSPVERMHDDDDGGHRDKRRIIRGDDTSVSVTEDSRESINPNDFHLG